MHSSLLRVARIFPEGAQERGEINPEKMFVQMFLAIIKEERCEKTPSEMGKFWGNGEKLKGWGKASSNIHQNTKYH